MTTFESALFKFIETQYGNVSEDDQSEQSDIDISSSQLKMSKIKDLKNNVRDTLNQIIELESNRIDNSNNNDILENDHDNHNNNNSDNSNDNSIILTIMKMIQKWKIIKKIMIKIKLILLKQIKLKKIANFMVKNVL